ncbi:hypothetical protein NX786_29410 [Telluria mixta]|uniref:Secreted protein n=1 Tax=Telluria mixta TaxID=34071 RepID=A0ABT2C7X1_9BURK|nr:hypothetical protein [Telluria mixta]MCS0633464.1 hypothetical protein [Telluria mixta]WEM96267.1 hypothetical protein P0M04_00520 [Telluria mixta]
MKPKPYVLTACALLAWTCAAHAQNQTQRTEQANRDAAVPDEASTTKPARTPPPAPLSYGPVLNPRAQQGADVVRKDPAEVHDEADTLTRQAPPSEKPEKKLSDKQLEELRRRAVRRHPASQGEGPMAPRPLRSGETPPATVAVPIPPRATAPQPTVPSTTVIRGCQGIVCTDGAGNTFNAGGNAGTSSTGRACARNGTTVTCF